MALLKSYGVADEDIIRDYMRTNRNAFWPTIKKCMSNGENVYLRGFGTFELKARKEKVARNITRRSTVIVPAHSVPVFKPAKEFKSVVENAKPAGKRARKK